MFGRLSFLRRRPKPDSPQARARWFRPRLSIRGLMIFAVVVGVGIGVPLQRARTRRDAVAVVNKAGRAWYDWQVVSGRTNRNATPPGPKWLRKVVAPELIDTVELVVLDAKRTSDEVMFGLGRLRDVKRIIVNGATTPALTSEGIAQIGKLSQLERITVEGPFDSIAFLPPLLGKPRLHTIWLESAVVSDSDLARLSEMPALEELRVDGRNITVAGFANLAKRTNLRILELNHCQVSELSPLSGLKDLESIRLFDITRVPELKPVSLRPLRGLSKLSTLVLQSNSVDDAELSEIKELPQLTYLCVAGEGVSEVGLGHIANLPRLGTLWLSRTSVSDLSTLVPSLPRLNQLYVIESPVTDDGLRALAGATSLRTLRLIKTKVTDDGLSHIAKLPALTQLSLMDTPISDAGLAKLSGLPSLETLDLRGTGVSQAGINSLKKAIPRLQIMR